LRRRRCRRSPVAERSSVEPQRGASSKMKPTVILVGADKGGVGKTTVARAVAD
jgi:Mrp family chromosome partitioning ATPase